MSELEKENIKIRACREDICFGGERIQLYGHGMGDAKSRYYVETLLLKEGGSGRYDTVKPFITIGEREAQILMNDLWDVGIRPLGSKGSAGQLVAVQNHLEDLRVILFHKLGIKKQDGKDGSS